MRQRMQTCADSGEHGDLDGAIHPTLFEALLQWVEKGEKPTPAAIAQRCVSLRPEQPTQCRFLPDYLLRPLATRIAPR